MERFTKEKILIKLKALSILIKFPLFDLIKDEYENYLKVREEKITVRDLVILLKPRININIQ